jgi:2-phosphosulfolactate phosphatase
MVDVALTPDTARPAPTTVVIDVLRATSTIVSALHAGYARVRCVPDLDAARALKAPGRVLAGERGCRRPHGFALGNSPSEASRPRGDELVLTTTNGVPALALAAALSPRVLVACLLNLDAVIEQLDGDTQILCSGTDGRLGLDDVYVAGRIAARLGVGTDAARVAQAVATGDARTVLEQSAGGRALVAAGLGSDLDVCARESITTVVPKLIDKSQMIIA